MRWTYPEGTYFDLARIARGLRLVGWLLLAGGGAGLIVAPGQSAAAQFDDAESAVAEQVEDQVTDNMDSRYTDAISEAIAASIAEAELGERVERTVEQIIADYTEQVEQERLEEQLESELESELEELVDGEVEQVVEEVIEESVAETVEETVEESVTGNIDESLDESIEESIVENVEDAVQETAEQSVEELLVDSVEESIAESVEEALEESLEESVASVVEESLEEQLADTVEEKLEDNIQIVAEVAIETAVEDSVEESVEQTVETGLEFTVDEQIAERVEDRLEAELEDKLEADEQRIHTDQWLVMAEPEVFVKLAAEGYIFDAVTELPGLGLQLAEVAAPGSFDISAARQGVVDVVGRDRVQVDLNHIYTAGVPIQEARRAGVAPREAIDFPADTDDVALRIGMIDSQVNTAHPSLSSPRIQSRDFSDSDDPPQFHGTAIASIIAGDDKDFRGLAPGSALYAASVFQNDREHGEIASTLSLVRALDWLVSSDVDVVNISLAGPPNRLLEAALKKVSERDVMLVAAAGNGGPVAKPMYPAAYDTVVAVTAVSQGGKVFRLANRGSYLDLAAPGVDLRHADVSGGYTTSSGTSFAVPFAAAAAARLRHLLPGQDVAQLLFRSARDLGPPGRDHIYGHGLLQPQPMATVATRDMSEAMLAAGPAGH